ncbi:uncharacterized protein LOC121016788 isoform X2 [Herpailurus yagouaroundi]|uniref:uncharacterized protein LOC121016788 isoform X2 n=1 Tax=Herpailurus yagouaroundi TaxID=1608482 RepID=UPI001AD6D8FE|nr:uncharacterized protein LOC121016788 isoform X2 [Puma yagouaroundi]
MAQLLWKTIWQFLKITVVPPLVHSFASHSFTYLWSAAVQKQMTLLTKHQKVNSSLMLHHNAYVIHLTSSYHIGIYHLSSSQEERHSLEVLEHIHVAWKGRTTATMELLYDPAILLLGIHRSTLNIPCHSLLACKVSPEKSADSFTVVPSQANKMGEARYATSKQKLQEPLYDSNTFFIFFYHETGNVPGRGCSLSMGSRMKTTSN